VLIPKENEKDIEEIPQVILKTVELELVAHMDDVLKKALVLEDPESFMKKSVDPTEEPPPFGGKRQEEPRADILPQ
jgi:ATP-dependent Lon protease